MRESAISVSYILFGPNQHLFVHAKLCSLYANRAAKLLFSLSPSRSSSLNSFSCSRMLLSGVNEREFGLHALEQIQIGPILDRVTQHCDWPHTTSSKSALTIRPGNLWLSLESRKPARWKRDGGVARRNDKSNC